MSSMEALIPVIGKLQDVFATLHQQNDIELPQIVVVGSQSAGKSSVIEGIVGRDFLPRGTGLVTRCPLLIHLHNTPATSPIRQRNDKIVDCDWAEFQHQPGNFYTDFDDVRKEIEAQTDRACGTNKNIKNEAIILNIYSQNVVNLSLVDLPGIVKNAIPGQPADIEDQVCKMIVSYIVNPKSIILAVTPANQDFATSEPLKLAKLVDADGDRTLGVLTKLDLMDQGTDAMDVLTNKLLPVKLGIIGVVNRSQADINNKKPIEDCLKDEVTFFYKKYPTLASKNGIQFLAKTLNRLLMHHIRECLPQLKLRVATMTAQCQSLLYSYGEPISDKNKTLLQIITHFSSAYTSTIDGNATNIETSELCGGARIGYIFHDTFRNTVEKIDPMGGLSALEILTAIRNATGPRPALFVPEVSFELLVKRQIRRLEEPSLNCVDLVYEELLRIVQHCGFEIQQEMHRFPRLYERINEVVSFLLSSRIAPTKEFVGNLVGIQMAYINTKHPEFTDAALVNMLKEVDFAADERKRSGSFKAQLKDGVSQIVPATAAGNGAKETNGWLGFGKTKELAPMETDPIDTPGAITTEAVQQARHRELTFREKRDSGIVERLIRNYFLIVRKSIQDMVPKAVMKFLVNNVRDNLQSELVRVLYNSEHIDDLLVESDLMAQRRKDASEMLEALNKANSVLSEIRETHIW